MNISSSLFLQTSYQDMFNDYKRSLINPAFPHWDYIVLTASDENQAENYRIQLDLRKKGGFLPSKTKFIVVPDKDNKRIGSGGATLSVLRKIAEITGNTDFKNLRMLVIHSGGDSKRVPQYSAIGKLFSPVPHTLDDGRSSTLFDEFIIAMSGVAPRIREGMLLLSGDVLLLFNPLQIDYSGEGAACISFKEDVETGKNHGVFLKGEDGCVKRFLHKQSVKTLNELGAVNEKNKVDIDTGAVIFSADMLKALYSLVGDDAGYDKYVNETVRLSLYGDFLYPLASDSTLEDFYTEKPEGEFCPELTEARKVIWEKLSAYSMKMLRLSPAKFIHFGTTREVLSLMNEGIEDYRDLGWDYRVNCSFSNRVSGYNSVLSSNAQIGSGCYLETAYVHSNAVVGDNCILSFIDIHDETIPSDVVVHGLKQRNGKFVCRIYGVNDNPKENKIFGKDISSLGLGIDSDTLWNAEIYPEASTVKSALDATLNFYKIVHGEGNVKIWKKARKKSLRSGFNDADPVAITQWNKRMADLVAMDRIAKLIQSEAPATDVVPMRKLSAIQKSWLKTQAARMNFSDRLRLYYYVGSALSGAEGDRLIKLCFADIGKAVLEASVDSISYKDDISIAKDSVFVDLPLRANFGGGWSDTPPYCNENGGNVLNASILLSHSKPVQVKIDKLKENKIIFVSKDMGSYGEFTSLDELQKTGDPFDKFALQKAALLATGIIPYKGGNIEELFNRFGGGFKIDSQVVNVPKGSGLGTSSILSAAVVMALYEFMGVDCTEDDIYSAVLVLEQIMSTGGGWQDQVGGVTGGFKFISSESGLKQNVKVEHLAVSPETLNEFNERFCLIYTGERRLARNLLRDVVGRYIGNNPDSLFALKEIQSVAFDMRKALLDGDIDLFAKLLDRHWTLSNMIDAGTTNTLIDQIFLSIGDLIDGKMVCGAGGGGFLQVIMKKGVTRQQIHERLKEVFQDFECDVWDAEIY